ncbi:MULTISPECIES: IS982 family transposase [Weeksellaceae]|uniref:IS982 family transposase n=1 Tax=Weeksellaceae TaxID=2762318 RepID=UPI0009952483|nr:MULTISPECIES: IS982 family transposase [Weeksellaceae]MDV3550507.1 IS982 family transposase [Elizabethkingia anophelis]AQX14152.1 transposase [Elizabethkingia meningoseptica]MDV3565272.1 IS982 family transposase [Elizabethkingia anophelis]MDV3612213.1 IS982 family transposase [Elizabethkingia anophelis]MDV3626630.1 IS982 family transposase [Elizabethkingia anophelis]
MHNFTANYEKILEVLKKLELDSENFLFQIRKPRLTDLRIIAINLTSEYMSIDSEHQLFRILPVEIKSLIERSVYNRRKRKLFDHIERIRKLLAERFNGSEKYFVVDSMPLEVCKLSRSSRSRICKETDYAMPNRGYCASQKMHYYGYKLHAVCSTEGVFHSLDISPASVHDIHYLKDIKQQIENCTILGDKGYLSAEYQLDLFTSHNIKLEVPMRKNQKNYKIQPHIIRKSRKRIETLFSQLCDQFMIRRNYAKSFLGFKTRILSKIVTLTIIQTINRIANRNINNLKINIT